MAKCEHCGEEYVSLSSHHNHFPTHKPKDWHNCYSCGDRFKQLSNHWRQSINCDYPDVSDEQMDILRGILMSDGWINDGWSNARIEIEMTNKKYLNYLNDTIFPEIGTEVGMKLTAEESYELRKQRGGKYGKNKENFSNIYYWRTVAHPEINSFKSWRENGKKVWPSDIDLTPEVLKHLYVGDGSYHQKDNYMKITTKNEMYNKEKIEKYFNNIGFSVNDWNINEYDNTVKADIIFSKEESLKLFDYMGSPPPGFEYKWPKQYRK
jgi:hypothetical protein